MVAGGSSAIEGSEGPEVGDTLRKVGDLSEWMRVRAASLLEEEGKGGGQGAAASPAAPGGGSCGFNLTLINRMECSTAKRDLKPDPLFAMGKCSVSWHADSCLEDFSTIGIPFIFQLSCRATLIHLEGVQWGGGGGYQYLRFECPSRRMDHSDYPSP